MNTISPDAFSDVKSSKEFAGANTDKQYGIARDWFAKNVSSGDEFSSYPKEIRDDIYQTFMKDIGLPIRSNQRPANANNAVNKAVRSEAKSNITKSASNRLLGSSLGSEALSASQIEKTLIGNLNTQLNATGIPDQLLPDKSATNLPYLNSYSSTQKSSVRDLLTQATKPVVSFNGRSIERGFKNKPVANGGALEYPIVAPEFAVPGMIASGIGAGKMIGSSSLNDALSGYKMMESGTANAVGSVAGDVTAQLAMEGINSATSDTFKKEYPNLSAALSLVGSFYAAGKVGGLAQDKALLNADKVIKDFNAGKIDASTADNVISSVIGNKGNSTSSFLDTLANNINNEKAASENVPEVAFTSKAEGNSNAVVEPEVKMYEYATEQKAILEEKAKTTTDPHELADINERINDFNQLIKVSKQIEPSVIEHPNVAEQAAAEKPVVEEQMQVNRPEDEGKIPDVENNIIEENKPLYENKVNTDDNTRVTPIVEEPIMEAKNKQQYGTGNTVENVIKQVEKLTGKTIDELGDRVNVVQTGKDLPDEYKHAGSNTQGFVVVSNNKMFLIADRIPHNATESTVLHEMVHQSINNGDKPLSIGLDVLANRLNKLSNNSLVKRAMEHATAVKTPADSFNEEVFAYLVSKYTEGKPNSIVGKLINDVVRSTKLGIAQALGKLGVKAESIVKHLNEKDIAEMLIRNAKKSVNNIDGYKNADRKLIDAEINKNKIEAGYKGKETTWDKIKESFISGMHPVMKTISGLKGAEEVENARRVYAGRKAFQAKELEAAKNDIVKSIKSIASDFGKNLDDFRKELNAFMVAQHAPERNKELGEGAAGISTKAAMDSLKQLRKENPELYKRMNEVANKVREISNKTLDTMLDGGLISKELYDKLKQTYKRHIPLNRILSESNDFSALSTGRGFSVKTSGVKRAKGSDLDIADVVVSTIANASQAIVRAEKNKVSLALSRVFSTAGGKMLGEIRGIRALGKSFDDKSMKFENPNADAAIFFYENGKRKVIIPKDPYFAKAYNGLNIQDKNLITEWIAPITKMMASMYTKYNPAFSPKQFVNDLTDSFIYNSDKFGYQAALKSSGNSFKAVGDIVSSMMGLRTEGAKMYEEMQKSGGTSGIYLKTIRDDIEKNIDTMFDGKNIANPINILHGFDKIMEGWNRIFEDAPRLAIYKTLRKEGIAEDIAGSAAKQTTVDFDERGTLTPMVNSAFAFFNASIQGQYTRLKSLGNPKTGIPVVTTAVGLTLWSESHNDSLDKEWRSAVPDFVRRTCYVVGLNSSKEKGFTYVAIPAGWVLVPFRVAAQNARDYSNGLIDKKDAAFKTIKESITAFNPLGGDTLASMITPTALDIPVSLATNQGFAGSPINIKEEKTLSKAQQYSDAMTLTKEGRFYIRVANKLEHYDIEVTPSEIKNITNALGGGTGKFAKQIVQMYGHVKNGEEIPVNDIPFASTFVRNTPEYNKLNASNINALNKSLDEIAKQKTFKDKVKEAGHQINKLNKEGHIAAAVNLANELEYGLGGESTALHVIQHNKLVGDTKGNFVPQKTESMLTREALLGAKRKVEE